MVCATFSAPNIFHGSSIKFDGSLISSVAVPTSTPLFNSTRDIAEDILKLFLYRLTSNGEIFFIFQSIFSPPLDLLLWLDYLTFFNFTEYVFFCQAKNYCGKTKKMLNFSRGF